MGSPTMIGKTVQYLASYKPFLRYLLVGPTSKNHGMHTVVLLLCSQVGTQELAGFSFHHCKDHKWRGGIVACVWLARCRDGDP